jgi:hypothetical protein
MKKVYDNSQKKVVIIGLDISTSVLGICAIDVEEPLKPLEISWLKLQKFKDMWQKADEVKKVLNKVKSRLHKTYGKNIIFRVAYEEPLQRLSSGKGGKMMSSAATIVKLSRFNGIVGYIAGEVFCDARPAGYTPHEARKYCKIKIQKGVGVKEKVQTYEQVVKLIGSEWLIYRTKNDGEVVVREECLDATDAWVVCNAYLENLKENGVVFSEMD